jgi:V/A-type H+-transporting ATPase subunit K
MNSSIDFKRKVVLSLVFMVAIMGMFAFLGTPSLAAQATAAEAPAASSPGLGWGLIAAAVAFGFGAIGAGIAIANVGAAAMGAIAEKPELASQALIFIALAEGLVVFGFITALMILGKV